ncbi:hypothetical protein RRG08_048462 [Elysia crispata]|uniref:Uncharacterized protein n=1 Tax=Elysia crispata TaxID=231223 RepID=A0AAE1B972_9GAST|nr:hypothetical protein RRG08_048462 [Elysia crispata]
MLKIRGAAELVKFVQQSRLEQWTAGGVEQWPKLRRLALPNFVLHCFTLLECSGEGLGSGRVAHLPLLTTSEQ